MKKTIVLLAFALLLFCPAVCPALGEGGGGESILVISDTHLTGEARDHEAMTEAVLRAARGRDAVLLGDNTNNTHDEEHVLALQWARRIGQETGAAVYVIPRSRKHAAEPAP